MEKKYYVEKGSGKTLKWRCICNFEPWTSNVAAASKFTDEQVTFFNPNRKIWPVEYIDSFKTTVFASIKRWAVDESKTVKINTF